jgi:SAM-dependent methyltransferase
MEDLVLGRIKRAANRLFPGDADQLVFNLPPKSKRFCTSDWQDDRFYLSSGISEVIRMMNLCGLSAESRLLDIGCGQGRIAIGASATLPNIRSYTGIDVHKPSIEWCQKYLARDRFHFLHVDTPNERYNPSGKGVVRLPIGSGAVDVAFLYSVFTHMHLPDIQAHLAEIARALVPGGRCLLTIYAEDWRVPEEENPEDYLPEMGKNVGALHRVVIDKSAFESSAVAAGFSVACFLYRSEAQTKQSVYVIEKS